MSGFSLGLPDIVGAGPLPRRLALLTLLRLVFTVCALALVGALYLKTGYDPTAFTPRAMLAALVWSFSLAGIYALVLRRGRGLERLADAQILLDQVTWTGVVYLTGGVSSGATSFYGLTCLVGASLTGLRGATIAAMSGGLLYVGLTSALARGWLAPPPDQPPNIYELAPGEVSFYLVVNVLVLVVVALLAGTLAERLRWTGGELKLATERADQAERMAALGRLAAGLAHEIRNPLGSIAGSIELLRAAPQLSEEDRRLCDIVQRETRRLNDLVTDMVDLARPRKPLLASVDVASLARELVELASRSGRAISDVAVRYVGEDSVGVRADGAQLRQLVWNLVRNAVQASGPGEEVVVRVVLRPDQRVELSVTDRGPGIDEQQRERLFDAFFTTRSQGAGIGLAVVKRIADEHRFVITVDSQAGSGATFRVDLGRAVPLSQPSPFSTAEVGATPADPAAGKG
ncbi:MAG: ATP-binding protein [Pseudomonadota bacterium]|nr:MAG: two-component sensor histidine kinase [Pseudomonadota bacterium]